MTVISVTLSECSTSRSAVDKKTASNMATFKELLQQDIGPATGYNYAPGDMPDRDSIVIHYNRYWGVATDTHCASIVTDEDGVMKRKYIITGSFVGRYDDFQRMLYSEYYQAIKFPSTWSMVMRNNKLIGELIPNNGQPAFLMRRAETEEERNMLNGIPMCGQKESCC